jgi:hypothetical protein
MEVHVTSEDIRRWKRGEVSPAEVVSIARHLQECSRCRELGAEEWTLRDLALDLEAIDEHPRVEDLVAYADGTLSPPRRGLVASHVVACARCRDDVEDRRSASAARTQGRPWLAAAAALVAVLVIVIAAALLAGRRDPPPVASDTATLTIPSTATVSPVDPMARLDPSLRAVAASLIDGNLSSATILLALHPGGGRERSVSADPAQLSVLGPEGVVVGHATPLFRWSGGAGPFTVEVFDDRRRMVATSPAVAGHEWRPPEPLPRSQVLTWQVRRDAEGRSEIAPRPPDPPARFQIASSTAIEAARATDSPLEAALIYAREGMIDEAREKLHEASKAGSTGQIRRMLATLDAAARQFPRPTTMNGAQ